MTYTFKRFARSLIGVQPIHIVRKTRLSRESLSAVDKYLLVPKTTDARRRYETHFRPRLRRIHDCRTGLLYLDHQWRADSGEGRGGILHPTRCATQRRSSCGDQNDPRVWRPPGQPGPGLLTQRRVREVAARNDKLLRIPLYSCSRSA